MTTKPKLTLAKKQPPQPEQPPWFPFYSALNDIGNAQRFYWMHRDKLTWSQSWYWRNDAFAEIYRMDLSRIGNQAIKTNESDLLELATQTVAEMNDEVRDLMEGAAIRIGEIESIGGRSHHPRHKSAVAVLREFEKRERFIVASGNLPRLRAMIKLSIGLFKKGRSI